VLEALDAPGVRGHGRRVLELAIERDAALASSPAPAGLDVALRLVDEVIFDLPIGEDVRYSQGYSAGVAAARDSLREALRAATRPAEDAG
jgi:hypothetical protein